jgi:hypothetical protein
VSRRTTGPSVGWWPPVVKPSGTTGGVTARGRHVSSHQSFQGIWCLVYLSSRLTFHAGQTGVRGSDTSWGRLVSRLKDGETRDENAAVAASGSQWGHCGSRMTQRPFRRDDGPCGLRLVQPPVQRRTGDHPRVGDQAVQ